MSGVSNGGLLVTLSSTSFPAPKTDGDSRAGTTSSIPDGANQDASNIISGIESTVNDLLKEIQDALAGAGRLILPGNGTFAMENPVFNKNSDLMVDIKYLPTETGVTHS